MRVLILSCNTGEGHNAAGLAIKEQLELQGHETVERCVNIPLRWWEADM